MKKKLIIGIDFSKSKFDVIALEHIQEGAISHEVFENSEQGYKNLLKWLPKQSKIRREEWLFCGEHTGLYSRGLANFLSKKGLFIWLENPLQIKQSSGIKRTKTDKADALVIANYAYRFNDKAKLYKSPTSEIESLQLLFSYRKELVKQKVQLEVRANEIRLVISHNATSRYIFENSQRRIENIKKEIAKLEDKMHEIIMQSEMRENYLLALSVKGIGNKTAICLLVHTDNFRAFETARQMASYCGAAPFPNSSGTMDKGSHISHLANKELKTLLTECARSAVQYNRELCEYYKRKIAEGKQPKIVINNVRNKLLQRVFACVKNKKMFDKCYRNPWADSE